MAQVKSARFSKEQEQAIEDMVDRGHADNESEAHRMLVNAGMREYGYQNGQNEDTALKAVIHRVSWLFMTAGLVGMAFTVAYPVPARLPSFAVTASGVFCFGVFHVLDEHEPKVSNRLKRIVGRKA